MRTARLIRRVRFAAAHRYRKPEWSDEKNLDVFRVVQHAAKRLRDLARAEYGCRHLIEKRLEYVVILAVDERDVNRFIC